VSPVDGLVQDLGLVDDNLFQVRWEYRGGKPLDAHTGTQIKHHQYAVEELLGSSLPTLPSHQQWYYAIVYLRPGGYHHFHSPVDWLIDRQLHITGQKPPHCQRLDGCMHEC